MLRWRLFSKEGEQGAYQTVALPFALKNILRRKEEELWKLKYIFTMKKYNLQKIL
jgi:hypothetical protein